MVKKDKEQSNIVKTVEKLADIPTTTKLLSSVDISTVNEVTTGNVYGTLGNGNDRQFEFTKVVQLLGQTNNGSIDCWTNTKQWTLTTEYKKATGLQVPLYHGLEIVANWDLFPNLSSIVETDYDPTLNVDGYGVKPVRRIDNTLGTVDKNDHSVILDCNFIHHGQYTTFIYDSNRDQWLIYHKKLGCSGGILYSTLLLNYGYIPVENGTGVDEGLFPNAKFIWGNNIPALKDTTLVGQSSNSPLKVVTQGQVESGGSTSNGGFFSLKYGSFYTDSEAYGGGVTYTEQTIKEDHAVTGGQIDPVPRKQVNLNMGITGINTGTETLTRRMGVFVYYVV